MGKLCEMDWWKTLVKWLRAGFFSLSFRSWVNLTLLNKQYVRSIRFSNNKKRGEIQWSFNVDIGIIKRIKTIREVKQKVKKHEHPPKQKIWRAKKNIYKDYEMIYDSTFYLVYIN